MSAIIESHLDTQVISYAFRDNWDQPIASCVISSIVANEFLLVQSDELSQANWYIPTPSKARFLGYSLFGFHLRDHPFQRQSADSIKMDFSNEFPTIIEYNNFSLANAINNGLTGLFAAATRHLDKTRRKMLIKRFRFIVDSGLTCIPLNQGDVSTAFDLLQQFRRTHNLKANFRNSWNDLLILSSAMNAGCNLITEDNELSRFVSELSGGSISECEQFVQIHFSHCNRKEQRASLESKGYINLGWRVQFYREQNSKAT